MTARDDYQALNDEVFSLYSEGRYDDALARVDAESIPERTADLAYVAACLLAMSDRPEEAFERLLVAEASGAWWHRRLLAEDDDLAALHTLDGYQDLVARSHARAEAAQAEVTPPLIRAPDGPARGLLVALHGADETAAHALVEWQSAVDAGFVLVAIESSQRNTPAYRSWPDPRIADQDLTAAYDGLPAAYRALPLVVSGFSAGGRQALRWALSATPGEPAAFVVLAPAVDPDRLPDPAAAVARGCSGLIMLGTEDEDVNDDALATYRHLNDSGLQVRLEEIDGLGHRFPADFPTRLRSALEDLTS